MSAGDVFGMAKLAAYLQKNYPDASGETAADRAINALERMDIDLGMSELSVIRWPLVSGWRVVPLEPTSEMLAAASGHLIEVGVGGRQTIYPSELDGIYKAMVAAAPKGKL